MMYLLGCLLLRRFDRPSKGEVRASAKLVRLVKSTKRTRRLGTRQFAWGRFHYTLSLNEYSRYEFISYILRFSHQILRCEKSVSDFTSSNQRGKTSFSHVKKSFRPITNQLKPRFKRIVFSRAFSRSSRVALSGSFDKILYFRCTRVVRNSNFQVIKS